MKVPLVMPKLGHSLNTATYFKDSREYFLHVVSGIHHPGLWVYDLGCLADCLDYVKKINSQIYCSLRQILGFALHLKIRKQNFILLTVV